ncbi:MAG TPA: EAL domain-containing protein [Rudaea sp.]|nr:EAL domain-containing protein [Rudaea sp.]
MIATDSVGQDCADAMMQILDARDLPSLDAVVAQSMRQCLGAVNAAIHGSIGASMPTCREQERLVHRALDENATVIDAGAEPDSGNGLIRVAGSIIADATLRAALVCELPRRDWEDPKFRARFEQMRALLRRRMQELHELDRLRGAVASLEQAEALQRALFAIADQSGADREMAEVYRRLHEIIGSLMYAENFYITLFDSVRDTLRFPYCVDVVDKALPTPVQEFSMEERRNSITWHLLKRGSPIRGTLPQIESEVGPLAEFGPDCVDWMGVPLLRRGKVVGAIVVQSYTETARYQERDQALLTFVAQHIQTALERRQLHEELERRVAERTDALRDANRLLQQQVLERQRGERLQAALFRIAELANSTESVEAFYASVHRTVGGLLYARNFYIALLAEDKGELTFPYSVDERDVKREPRPLGDGLTEYVLRTGQALLADQTGLDRLYASGAAQPSGARSRSWLGVPLICGERTVGVLAVQSHSEEHQYTTRDQELLTFVSYHIANALERKRTAESLKQAYADMEQRVIERTSELATVNRELREHISVRERMQRQLKHETLHDALTGLPNRNFLLDRLGQSLAAFKRDPRHRFAVLFLDLDRFKVVNDSVGHLIGDELLNEVGSRIAGCLEPRDLVARLGGDEFAILLNDIEDAEDACFLAQRIIDALNAPIRVGGKEIFTSTSIGIAIGSTRYQKAEELLRDSDVAMYRAKAEGRHRYALFDQHLHQEAMHLLELESDLRRAIARNEFMPFFQPIVSLADRVTVGYEGLLRWEHPRRGLLLPADFLAVAEESGAAEEIDWQMFERVFEIAPALLQHGGFIGINLSGRHFRSEALVQTLLDLLKRHGFPPSQVRMEVTERMLIENPPAAKRMLEALREKGLGVSLDDFGTGYSSLSYLHQYPVQALKIDRSFISDLSPEANSGTTPVVRAILALAGALGMQVIAEGIETEAQHDALVKLGCKYGQGYLYARPQPAHVWIERAPTA